MIHAVLAHYTLPKTACNAVIRFPREEPLRLLCLFPRTVYNRPKENPNGKKEEASEKMVQAVSYLGR
jgi:hypothetical protein